MASTDPILTALTLMEGRLLQRMEEWRRDFKLDLDGRFDAIHKRLDYLEQEYEMIKAGLARLEADVGTLKTELAFLKGAVMRLEARQEEEAPERQDLREQVLAFRRHLGELEGRVKEIEGRLSRP